MNMNITNEIKVEDLELLFSFIKPFFKIKFSTFFWKPYIMYVTINILMNVIPFIEILKGNIL